MSLAVNCKKPITSYLNYEFENTFIFAAVHNTFGSIEKILEPMNGNFTKAEPTFSFLKRPKGPYYLVGGLDENGIIKSLFSDKGENILTVGNGAWSINSSCAPQAFGSSFATPEIAVYVWLMKNYFKNKGEKLSTENIALRLLLSADLTTTCLGKFSSAGVPNLNKMMAGGKGFVVKNDSIITLSGIKRASSIRYSLFDQLPSFKYLSNDIKSDNNIYGIGLIENSILIFDKNKMLWKKVESVESIDIELQYIDGKTEVLKSYEDLINTGITQIVTYN